jgi:hypothetical protein
MKKPLVPDAESCNAPTAAELQDDARYYVYVHQDVGGRIFYVGMGTGDRAWSVDRDVIWNHYVRTRLNGRYEVRVIVDGLSEEEALEREVQLMAELANQVVNRQNMGRPVDIPTLNRMSVISQERDDVYAQGISARDPVLKLQLFQRALELHRSVSKLCPETGIFGELLRELPPLGHIELLDSLVRAHIDLGDARGAATALDDYVAFFPGHADHKQFLANRTKVDRFKAGKKVRGSPKAEEFTPPDVLPPDWERVQGSGLQTIRLKRNLRLRKGSYLDTVEPLKQLRRENKYREALALMKAAVVDAEEEVREKRWLPPPFYFMEAAKACRSLGDFQQECLFLHRYLVLTRSKGGSAPDFVKRLGVAAAKLRSSKPA